MSNILRDIPIFINSQQVFANSVELSSSASLSPSYYEGNRHSFKYTANAANINLLSLTYYLTGNDPLKNYLSRDDTFITGRISNIAFNSGCLTNYSVRFIPNAPIEVNASFSIFDYFSGAISPNRTTKRIIPLNASNLLIENATSGTVPLGNFESATFEYQADISPVYSIQTGLNNVNISPNRVSWGRKQIKMSIVGDNIDLYLPTNGQDTAVRIAARDFSNNDLEVFSVSGKISKKSSSLQSNTPISQSVEIIQNRIEASPSVTSFSPASASAGQFINVFGSNFNNITNLYLDKDLISNFTRIDDSSITFQVPDNANSGYIRINSFEESTFSPSGLFLTYPSILANSFTPTNIISGNTVLIYGSNFYKISDVKFNNISSSFSVLSDTSIQAIAPGRTINGPISVLSSSRNTSGQTPTNFYSSPVIDSFSPRTGVPGTIVSITGQNFANLSSVKVNGLDTSYSIVNLTNITFPVPTGNSWGTVKVTNAVDQFSETPYSFIPQIIVTGSWPRSGVAYTPHAISGINFQTGLMYELLPEQYKVSFNGTITGFYLQNQNKLTGLVPRGALNGPVYVYKSDGVSTYSTTGSFIYIDDAPNISKAFPSGLISGNSLDINIIGENIRNLTRIYLTGVSTGVNSGKSIVIWDKNYNINSIPVDNISLRTLNTTASPDYFGLAANVKHNFSPAYSLSGNAFLTGLAVNTGNWRIVAENIGGTGTSYGPIFISELPKISHFDTNTISLSSNSSTTDALLNAPIYALDGNVSTYMQTSQFFTTGTITFRFSNLCQIHRIKVTTFDQLYTNDGANPRYLKFNLGTGLGSVFYSGQAQVSSFSTYTTGFPFNTGTQTWRQEANYVQIQSHYTIAGVEQILPLRLAEIEIYGIPTYR